MPGVFAMLRAALPRGLKRVARRIVIDLGGDYHDALFLAGSHRSGTTWLSKVVGHAMDVRDMYEPFNGERVPIARAFTDGLYLRPEDDAPAHLDPARGILAGKIRNRYVDKGNRRFVFRRRLIKETHANLWLKWLKMHFPQLPIALLVRHPCAVAASRLRLGMPTRLANYLAQPRLCEDHLAPYVDMLTRAAAEATPFEHHIYEWCVQQLIPLRQLSPGDVHLVFYERLHASPETELPPLLAHFGSTAGPEAFAALARPSSTAGPDSAIVRGRDPVADWRSRVSQDQVESAVRILDRFGLGAIYGAGPMPDAGAAATLFGAASRA